MSAAVEAEAARSAAALFRLTDRALLAVRGGDRVRWLDGMLTQDIRGLGAGRSGCQALLLTRTGRIVAELRVLWRPEELWLEMEAAALGAAVAHLEKFIIADDVTLHDQSAAHERLGLEGPRAGAVLEAAAGALPALEPGACADLELAGFPLTLARYGWSGEPAFQLLAPAGSGPSLAAALGRAGAEHGLVEAGPEALEILRIEAGTPRHGRELDESVLPDEAGLGHAVSTSKGCYTGQEVVARLRSQGQVGHLLMGLQSEGESLLPCDVPVLLGDRRIGEVTSSCLSPRAGSIALAYLKRPHCQAGTAVQVEGREARVAALPFAGPGAGGP